MKKYELPSSILKKSTYKPPLDNKKIDGVLEKELLKFMTKNKETINLNFLNLEKLKRHKNIATMLRKNTISETHFFTDSVNPAQNVSKNTINLQKFIKNQVLQLKKI